MKVKSITTGKKSKQVKDVAQSKEVNVVKSKHPQSTPGATETESPKNKSDFEDPTVAGGKKVASSPKKAPSTPSRHHKASDPEH